jgi:ATP-binding cassette, subfamily B, bacterial
MTDIEAVAELPAEIADEDTAEDDADVGAAADALRRLSPYFRPYRKTQVLVALGLLVDVAFDAFWPLAFKFLIDDGLIPKDATVLVEVLVILGIGVIVTSAVGVSYHYLNAKLCSDVLADVRAHMFRHLQRLSLGFYSRSEVGDVLARFSGDMIAVENAMISLLPWAVKPTLDIVASTLLLFVLDWRLALVSMVVWPVALLGPRVFTPKAVASSYEKKRREAAALSVVQEDISGHVVVKAFGLEDARLDGFQRRNTGVRRSSVRTFFLGSLVERSASTGILILGIVVIGIGSWMTFEGWMTIGTLVAFQSLFFTLGYSISAVAEYVPGLVQGLGGFRHIGELFDNEPEVVDAGDARPARRLSKEIAFDAVTFRYPEAEEPSLRVLDLAVPRGASVALVGPSGSGKSTALSLLMRFYDPTSGSIRIDDEELAEVTQASVREQTGVVFQESFLFNVSIRENIRLGNRAATDAEVEEAARAAEIHDFVGTLPEGYEAFVGERGGRLSGGQRQRIAIARAIVRNPAILLLDEATSALDPATEAAINATLRRLAEGRTAITVTHRLTSAKDAERIFVLDRGSLVESGTHEELLAAQGVYHGLWQRQSGFTLSDEGDRAEVAIERLQHVPVLSELDETLLSEIAHLFASEQVPAGRTVIQQGDPGDRFYLVVRGRLAVSYRESDGSDELVAVLEDGDHFGEIALLRKAPRVATVTAEVPSLLLSLAQEHFLDVLERAPDVRRSLERIVEGRLAEIHQETWGRPPL